MEPGQTEALVSIRLPVELLGELDGFRAVYDKELDEVVETALRHFLKMNNMSESKAKPWHLAGFRTREEWREASRNKDEGQKTEKGKPTTANPEKSASDRPWLQHGFKTRQAWREAKKAAPVAEPVVPALEPESVPESIPEPIPEVAQPAIKRPEATFADWEERSLGRDRAVPPSDRKDGSNILMF